MLTPINEVLLKTNLLFCLLAFYILSCSPASSKSEKAAAAAALTTPDPVPAADLARYQAAIRQFMDSNFRRGNFNGSILVAKKGQIIYEEYGGFSHYKGQKDSITSSTPFHLASVSKTITAMAVLKLWEEKKLSIDDSVSKYLIGFPLEGVTIRTLLNHRSGLPNYVHYMERLGWDKKKRITNQEVLDFIIARHSEMDIARPNRGFSYSNTNYALLALLVEKVGGLPFGEYIQKTIFDPLQMKNSYVFSIADSARSMPSYFYNGRQYAFDFLDLVYGDKNVYSTVEDLQKFERSLAEYKFLSKASLDEAYIPYSNEKPGTHNYGLGWRMLLLKNGKKIIYHNGWWHGNRSAFYRLPDEEVTIIALCNNDSKMIYSTKKLADLFGNYLQTGDKENDDENSPLPIVAQKKPAKAPPVKKKKASQSSKKRRPAPKK